MSLLIRVPKLTISLGGASRGALISLFTGLLYQNKIECLLLESRSLFVFNHQIMKDLCKQKIWPERVYLGIGTKEGETNDIQNMALTDALSLKDILELAVTDYKFLKDDGATHDIPTFAKRFTYALEYLYPSNW